MTQEDKALLLKDLSARLPYGVKVKIEHYDNVWDLLAIYTNGTTYASKDVGYPIETYSEKCKPYLFPLSSMTEEQKMDLTKFVSNGIYNENIVYDWYNKNHFDYRGLIEKGLALDATGKKIY